MSPEPGTPRIRRRLEVLAALIGVCWAAPAGAAPFAYITNGTDGTVSVLDTASNTVVATVTVGSSPTGVAVNPVGTRVYVTNFNSPGTMSVLDTASNTVVATVTVGSDPF